MSTADEIVVFAEPRVTNMGGAYYACLPALGLSASCAVRAAAIDNVVRMFVEEVAERREDGTLDRWLRDSGLTWGLASDFPEAKSRFRG